MRILHDNAANTGTRALIHRLHDYLYYYGVQCVNMPFYGVLCTAQDKRRRYNCACIVGACASPNKNRLHTTDGGIVQKIKFHWEGETMKNNNITIIRIRKGLNGFKYSACDSKGNFLSNFEKLADVRKHWKNEIKWGQVQLVRELDQMPDMTRIEETRKNIQRLLRAYVKH